jgi:hypothetical protein
MSDKSMTEIGHQQQFCCCADAAQKWGLIGKFELHSSTVQVVAKSKLADALFWSPLKGSKQHRIT